MPYVLIKHCSSNHPSRRSQTLARGYRIEMTKVIEKAARSPLEHLQIHDHLHDRPQRDTRLLSFRADLTSHFAHLTWPLGLIVRSFVLVRQSLSPTSFAQR